MTSSTGVFTYWSLLGVSSDSDADQIKRAFRREARRWHPDLNRNSRSAEERFKWINEAYTVLSDPSKRLAWEAAGRPAFQIEVFPSHPTVESNPSKESPPSKVDSSFNAAEKLLLTLISILFLFFLNNYVL